MGNTTSTVGRECLLSAVGGNGAFVSFQDEPLYDITAVHEFNLNFPVEPAAVTYPETTEQVSAIVKCAAQFDFKVQARSGGHSFGNYGLGGADGAIVVDMKHFTQFSLDESTNEATIGPGSSLGDVDIQLYNAGERAMTHGVCPGIGFGGHVTIGGLGPTERQWGTALDHIQEAEIVLADGSIVRASDTQNSDLLFAVKGAAAGFGIVTEFKVRTQQAPGLAVSYSYTFNIGNAAEKAQLFRDWQTFISDENLSRKLEMNFVILEGIVIIEGIFFGSEEEYEALGLEDRFAIKNPGTILVLTDWLGMVGHAVEDTVVRLLGGVPSHFYAKSLGFSPSDLIPSSDIDELFEYIETVNKGTVAWFVTFSLAGGRINDFPTDATAYAHRDVLFWMQVFAVDILGPVSDTIYGFVNGVHGLLEEAVPESGERAYLGCPDPLLPDAQRAYWGGNLDRLMQIKAEVDPKDMFHNPQGVPLP
ncbi:hypothetical protein FQN54_005061 [Arachnomyces sp. PD_36]|nr:hypothetical protein FQN54_005061 [Arachnomyces sp. PD_36]